MSNPAAWGAIGTLFDTLDPMRARQKERLAERPLRGEFVDKQPKLALERQLFLPRPSRKGSVQKGVPIARRTDGFVFLLRTILCSQ